MRDPKHIKYIEAIYAINNRLPGTINKDAVKRYIGKHGVQQSVFDYLKSSGDDHFEKDYTKLQAIVSNASSFSLWIAHMNKSRGVALSCAEWLMRKHTISK